MTRDLPNSGHCVHGEAPTADDSKPCGDEKTDNLATQFHRLSSMPTWSNSVQLLPCPTAAE